MEASVRLVVLYSLSAALVAGCALHPGTDELSHHEKAIQYERAGKFELAAHHYRKAIAVDPDYAPLYASLGYVYMRIGKLDSAKQMLEKAVSMDSTLYQARANLLLLGFANVQRPRKPAAVSYFLDPGQFDKEVLRTTSGLGIPPALVLSIAKVESNFDPFAYNSMGAAGLMQLMPETARNYGLRVPGTCRTGRAPDTLDPRVDERFHPLRSVEAATRYLNQLIEKYREGNRLDLYLPLAAYNAGPAAVAPHHIPKVGLGYARKVGKLFSHTRGDEGWLRSALRKIREEWMRRLKGLGMQTSRLNDGVSAEDSAFASQTRDIVKQLTMIAESAIPSMEKAQILVDAAALLSYLPNYEAAVANLRLSCEIVPDSARWRAWAADLLLANRKAYQAMEVARETIRLDSTNALAWTVLGEAAATLGHFDHAEDYLDEAVRLDSCFGRAWNDLGVVKVLQLRLQAAEKMLRKAIACDSVGFLPWYNLALSLFLQTYVESYDYDLRQALAYGLCDSMKFYSLPQQKEYRPLAWPSDGPVTSVFGWRPDPFNGSLRKCEFHTGIDIDGSIGDTVLCPAKGIVEVVRRGYNGGYGNMVIIEHNLSGQRFETGFHHLDRIFVQPGEAIDRGRPVGTIGSTGRSTGSHLHFMVWKNGKLVNPLFYLAKRVNHGH